MCSVPIVFTAISAIGTGMAEHQSQMAAYNAKRAEVIRSNMLAQQKFDHETLLIAKKEKEKGQIFEAQKEAAANAQTALAEQQRANQLAQINASEANQLQLQEKITERAFETQANLIAKVQAQGTTLASGMNAGQSMLLELGQADRELGMKQAAIDASIFDATKASALTEYGIALDHYSADNKAQSQLPALPSFAPTAELSQVAPIFQSGPTKPSMLGPAIKGFTAGFKTYTTLEGDG